MATPKELRETSRILTKHAKDVRDLSAPTNAEGTNELEPLDNTVSFACSDAMAPTRFREDNEMIFLHILPPRSEPGQAALSIAGTSFIEGDAEIRWGENKPDQVVKCTVTNFGKEPVLGVAVDLIINWQISQGPGKPFKTVAQQTHRSPVFNLGASVKNDGYFYIDNNNTDYYIFIPSPVSAYGFTPENQTVRKFRLAAPATPMPGMFLYPKVIKGPPTASSPSESPAGK